MMPRNGWKKPSHKEMQESRNGKQVQLLGFMGTGYKPKIFVESQPFGHQEIVTNSAATCTVLILSRITDRNEL